MICCGSNSKVDAEEIGSILYDIERCEICLRNWLWPVIQVSSNKDEYEY